MKTFKTLLILLALSGIVFCAEEKSRRRKVRRKIIRRPATEVVEEYEPETAQDEGRSFPRQIGSAHIVEDAGIAEGEEGPQGMELIEEDRAGRGYLDNYYAKYDRRVQQSQLDNLNKRQGHQYVYVAKNPVSQEEYDLMKAASIQATSHADASDRRQLMSEQRSFNTDDNSANFDTIEQTASPGTRYVQHVSLPKQMPDDSTYMYSAVHPSEAEDNEILDSPPRKIMPGALYDGMSDHYIYSKDTDSYETPSMYHQGAQQMVYLTEPVQDEQSMDANSKSDYFSSEASYVERDSGYSADSARPGLGKFFGLTGTTSQNIQLGLTFTVPFLQVPLNSLNGLFNGGGIGDLFSGLDTTNLFAVGLVAAGAIFVLPMIIYWLTGINLSAFNWSRSDDEGGLPMGGVVRSIEEALMEYDIDTRTCLARTMCNQYQTKLEEEEKSTAARISRGILDNLAGNSVVQKYVGENRINEALSHGTSKRCKANYKHDVCPWDTSAIIKVTTKLLTSGNIDFASLASAAAKVAASNLS